MQTAGLYPGDVRNGKIGFEHTEEHIRDIIHSKEMAIETFLYSLKNFILLYQEKEEEKRVRKEEKLNTIREKMLNLQGGLTANRGEPKSKLVTELTEIVGILEAKIKRMEITLGIKEEKVQGLTKKLQEKGITV